MSTLLRIDQAGLSDGEAGRSRTDGKADGSLVTVTNTGSGTTTFRLLWTPPGDTTAVTSLAATGDPKVWTFSPMASRYGTYLIELIQNIGTINEVRERRTLGIRTPVRGLLVPALNERGDMRASLVEPGTGELADNNAEDYPDADLNALPFAAWWRAMHELVIAVDAADTLVANTIRSFFGEVTIFGAAWPDGVNGGRLYLSGASSSLSHNDGGEVEVSSALGGTMRIAPFGHFTMPTNATHLFGVEISGDLETAMLLGIVGGAPAVGFLGAAPVTRPSITGTTTQQQVDSLVAALEALGLVSDGR